MVVGHPTFVLAPDSFKESLTAREVAAAMEVGLRASYPDARYLHVPMADGGEGTTQSLVDATGGTLHDVIVTGPLGEPVTAQFGILGDGETGVLEMASAAGIHLTEPSRRDPLRASTVGVGQLISACLDRGLTRLIVGLGGSGTNDGGAGMAQALGARLLDRDGNELPRGGQHLADLHHLDVSGLDPRLASVTIEVACDVTNPLCGPQGASAVYGPQKGASEQDVTVLDAGLQRYADVIAAELGREVAQIPGAGAAGGLGAGLLAFTEATLRPGVEIVIDHTGLRDHVATADLVITGEGRMDGQTRMGKTPYGVAQVARAAGKPVIAITGSTGDGIELLDDTFAAILPIIPRLDDLDVVLDQAADNVARTCRAVGALLRLTLPPGDGTAVERSPSGG